MSQSASVALVTSSELDKISQYRPNLKPGDKIEGKVIKNREDGKTVLDFGKFQAAVELDSEVKEGEILRFVVVEKGKQLILKIESTLTKTSGNVENRISQANLQQEKSIEELQSKIDQLLQKESLQNGTSNQDQRVDQLLKDIKNQLGNLKESIQTETNREPLPKEIQKDIENLLKNLDITLRRVPSSDSTLTTQRLETLDRALRNLGTSLESNRQQVNINEIREHLTQEVDRLKEIVEKSNLNPTVKKDIEAAISKLSEAITKIGNLNSQEQLPELQKILSNEINPRLAEIQKILSQSAPATQSTGQEAAGDIKIQVETLQKEIDSVIHQTPPSARDIDALLKSVEAALKEVSETSTDKDTAAIQKNVSSNLIKLREQLLSLETKQALPDNIKVEAEHLLKNAANILRNIPTSNESSQVTDKLAALAKAIENIQTGTATANEFYELRDQVADRLIELNQLLKQSNVKVSKEVEIQLAKLEEAAQQIKQLNDPRQLAELQEIITKEIQPGIKALQHALSQETVISGSDKFDLVNRITQQTETLSKDIESLLQKLSGYSGQNMEELLKNADTAMSKLSDLLDISRFTQVRPSYTTSDYGGKQEPPTTEISNDIDKINQYVHALRELSGEAALSPTLRNEINTLMQQAAETVKQLPQTPEAAEQAETLALSVRNLRTTFETVNNFNQLREQIVKEIEQLQNSLKDMQLDSATRKETEALMTKLTAAAEKISQLKSVDQLNELRQVIQQEIKPNLTALNETLEHSITNTESTVNRETAEIINRVENMQRTIDTALEKLPSQPPKEIEPLLKDVESALSKLSEATSQSGRADPQFSESIQTLYENIKVALRLLQTNIQISGDKLELPEQIRNIFQGLQTDIKLSEVNNTLSTQLTQLRALIEDAGIPFPKVVGEMLNSIDDMLAQLGELKANGTARQMQTFIQQQLRPLLESMGNILNNHHLLGELEHPQQLTQAAQTVRSMQTGIENLLSKGLESPSEFSQLNELSSRLTNLSPEVKEALLQAPAGQRISESISHLARNIENLLSGIADKMPETQGHQTTSSIADATGLTGMGSTTGTADAESAEMTAKIRTLLSTLRSHFEPLDIGQDALKLVPRLKSLIDDSGFFFEKKLSDIISRLSEASDRLRNVQTLDQLPEIKDIIEKDMKPNLMQLRELLNNEKLASQLGDAKTIDSIRHAVEDMLANISQQQSRALEQHTNQNPVQAFSFHVPIKGEENPAELKIFYNKNRKKDTPEEYKLSLLLDMEQVGEIRSDFFQLKEDLTITFYVKDDDVKDYFDSHLTELEDALGPVFDSLNLNVIVSRKKIAAFESGELEEEIISEKAVNVKV